MILHRDIEHALRDQLVDQDLASGAGIASGHEGSLRALARLGVARIVVPRGYDRPKFGARPKPRREAAATSSHAIGNGQRYSIVDFRRADDRRRDRRGTAGAQDHRVRLPSPAADLIRTDITLRATGSIAQRALPDNNLPVHSEAGPSSVDTASW